MRFSLYALIFVFSFLSVACDPAADGVVVYTSVDDVFARPVLEAFERETGIPVLLVTDVEASKTTGLYHRLLDERFRPRADVFWNSEVARTIQLADADVLAPYLSPSGGEIPTMFRSSDELWTGFGARARVLIYHRERVAQSERPRSIYDLAAPRFRGEAAIADPLFGTTATHAGALHAKLGKVGAEKFFRDLMAGGVRVLAGNSTVRDRVASGELKIGLTDTDDVHVALLRGLPVGFVFPDQENPWPGQSEPLGTFLIPNTVALIRGGPRPELGKQLVDYLLRPQTEEALAAGESAQLPVRPGLKAPERLVVPEDLVVMDVSYDDVARGVGLMTEFLRQSFVR